MRRLLWGAPADAHLSGQLSPASATAPMQMDTDAAGHSSAAARVRPTGQPNERTRSELVIPVFGYKNHLGIDRRTGLIRSFIITDAASHDGHQLGKLLDPHNTASGLWADTAYRSAANTPPCWRGRAGAVVPSAEAAPQADAPRIARGNASRPQVRVPSQVKANPPTTGR